jgi:hypothetical protein
MPSAAEEREGEVYVDAWNFYGHWRRPAKHGETQHANALLRGWISNVNYKSCVLLVEWDNCRAHSPCYQIESSARSLGNQSETHHLFNVMGCSNASAMHVLIQIIDPKVPSRRFSASVIACSEAFRGCSSQSCTKCS